MAKGTEQTWLTRAEIDAVVEQMSAADIMVALKAGASPSGDTSGAIIFGLSAFDAAAARQGASNGTAATEHVHMSDLQYLAEKVGGAVNTESPLSEETDNLLDSAATGE